MREENGFVAEEASLIFLLKLLDVCLFHQLQALEIKKFIHYLDWMKVFEFSSKGLPQEALLYASHII